MPVSEISYLVRGPDGMCRTVQGRSPIGALKAFLRSDPGRRLPSGVYVSVKERGAGEWIDYRITR